MKMCENSMSELMLTTYFPYIQINIYCSCKMPETYDDMVECENCEEWFHVRCVKGDLTSEWICNYCIQSGSS